MFTFNAYIKFITSFCVCIFLIPVVTFADLSPQVDYERACERAFGGKVIKIENRLVKIK